MKATVSAPTVVIGPSRGLFHLDLETVWRYRELLYFLTWRDIRVRYKQTAIGAAWSVIQPVASMVVFTIIFGNFAKMPSDGVPYPIFAYAALLPWYCFSQALNNCGHSLVGDASLLRKVYFPRLIIPLASVVRPVVDFVLAFVVLLGMMAWFRIAPTWRILTLPLFLFVTVLTALAIGLWLAALNVRYRDVGYVIPFLMQMWMFASPVAYPVSVVPEKWRLLYGLNPMTGVIGGFRWALLGQDRPDAVVCTASAVVIVAVLLAGLLFFRQAERTFADVV